MTPLRRPPSKQKAAARNGEPPFKKILVANLENGQRFETYIIKGKRGSRVACLNGAAAHCGAVGDRLIVMAWCQLTPAEARRHKPQAVRFNARNAIVARAT